MKRLRSTQPLLLVSMKTPGTAPTLPATTLDPLASFANLGSRRHFGSAQIPRSRASEKPVAATEITSRIEAAFSLSDFGD
jgi:hypothetical protein